MGVIQWYPPGGWAGLTGRVQGGVIDMFDTWGA